MNFADELRLVMNDPVIREARECKRQEWRNQVRNVVAGIRDKLMHKCMKLAYKGIDRTCFQCGNGDMGPIPYAYTEAAETEIKQIFVKMLEELGLFYRELAGKTIGRPAGKSCATKKEKAALGVIRRTSIPR